MPLLFWMHLFNCVNLYCEICHICVGLDNVLSTGHNQTVNYRPLAAKLRVQSQVSPIFFVMYKESGIGTGFHQCNTVSLCYSLSPKAARLYLFFCHQLHMA
jgi:hypothetical protein